MLFYLTSIFLCQLLGEALVTLLGLPIPGAVIGMALLFIALLIKGGIPTPLAQVGDTLLQNLSLLFIPAGVGVMLHADLLGREILPVTIALLVSSGLAIAITGLLMQWLNRKSGGEEQS